MANEKTATLTSENIKWGLLVVSKSSPEWGTWRIKTDSNGWTIHGRTGEKVLFECSFKYWRLAD